MPTNWPAEPVPPGERPNVVVNIQGAAFANRMFVAAACRVGAERGVSWVGGSLDRRPGRVPAGRPGQRRCPELVIADCDLARARDKATSPRNDPHSRTAVPRSTARSPGRAGVAYPHGHGVGNAAAELPAQPLG